MPSAIWTLVPFDKRLLLIIELLNSDEKQWWNDYHREVFTAIAPSVVREVIYCGWNKPLRPFDYQHHGFVIVVLTDQQTGSQQLRLLQSDLFAALFSKLATRNAMLYSAYFRRQLEKLPLLPVDSDAMQILHQASQFKQRILELIAQAERRIIWWRSHLQDDEAGREIMQALYAAKQARPHLDIQSVC